MDFFGAWKAKFNCSSNKDDSCFERKTRIVGFQRSVDRRKDRNSTRKTCTE